MRGLQGLQTAAWSVGVLMLLNTASFAADRMVSVALADGAAMLVRRFDLSAGSRVLGVAFESNDPGTSFARIVLVRAEGQDLFAGLVLGSTSGIPTTAGGVATVLWDAPITIDVAGAHYVGICPPAGLRRIGPGVGPGIGATDGVVTGSSFVTYGEAATLLPICAELSIALIVTPEPGSLDGPHKSNSSPGRPPADSRPATERLRLEAINHGSEVLFHFALPRTDDTSLQIFDVAGRQVRDLVRSSQKPGHHRIAWDQRDDRGRSVGRGIYFAKLCHGYDVTTIRVVTLR